MGTPGPAESAFLFAALFSSDRELIDRGASIVSNEWGEAASASELFVFDETDYYSDEMGHPLFKLLCLFQNPFDPGSIADAKLYTNSIEKRFSEEGNRKLNIDPGYITLTKVVLATTKNYSHRIYIAKGIYAEITLSWKKGVFRANPWTYPDYQRPAVIAFFNKSRKKLRTLINPRDTD